MILQNNTKMNLLAKLPFLALGWVVWEMLFLQHAGIKYNLGMIAFAICIGGLVFVFSRLHHIAVGVSLGLTLFAVFLLTVDQVLASLLVMFLGISVKILDTVEERFPVYQKTVTLVVFTVIFWCVGSMYMEPTSESKQSVWYDRSSGLKTEIAFVPLGFAVLTDKVTVKPNIEKNIPVRLEFTGDTEGGWKYAGLSVNKLIFEGMIKTTFRPKNIAEYRRINDYSNNSPILAATNSLIEAENLVRSQEAIAGRFKVEESNLWVSFIPPNQTPPSKK